jgi:hypothetical protein
VIAERNSALLITPSSTSLVLFPGCSWCCSSPLRSNPSVAIDDPAFGERLRSHLQSQTPLLRLHICYAFRANIWFRCIVDPSFVNLLLGNLGTERVVKVYSIKLSSIQLQSLGTTSCISILRVCIPALFLSVYFFITARGVPAIE